MTTTQTGLSESPLDVDWAVNAVTAPSHGGIGVFIGIVRESAAILENESKRVIALDYDAHPTLAPRRLAEIADEAAAKWDVGSIVAVHRTGRCVLGDPTVVVACGAPHRGDALEACHWMIDTIKATVPIWKREIYADGSSWVGAQSAGAGI